MKTIILPGYSPKNKKWAYEVRKKLNLEHKIMVHEWEHWEGGSMSLNKEKERILNLIKKDKINIIAKSVGTRVSMYLIPVIKDQLNKLVLCGIPTKFENKDTKKVYSDGLTRISAGMILVIQNKKDPFASSEIIKKIIREINPKIEVVEKDRSDHNYPYFQELQSFLS